jgi:hypothetical protein
LVIDSREFPTLQSQLEGGRASPSNRDRLSVYATKIAVVAQRHKEAKMHITEVVWWSYAGFVALAAVFFLVFAWLVQEKGDRHG